jgi:hypothetical protein
MGRNGCYFISDKEPIKQSTEAVYLYGMNERGNVTTNCAALISMGGMIRERPVYN